MQSTPDSVIVYGTEMSKTPADKGITSVNAAIALIALTLRIWRTVSACGNVSGTQIENTTIMISRT